MEAIELRGDKKFIFCFSLDFGSECLQKRKKSASMSVFVLDFKTKDNKIVLQLLRAFLKNVARFVLPYGSKRLIHDRTKLFLNQ